MKGLDNITFRGIGVSTNNMRYGDLIHRGRTRAIIDNEKHTMLNVRTETIGIYAGIKDKNDTKIYHGDIVRIMQNERAISISSNDKEEVIEKGPFLALVVCDFTDDCGIHSDFYYKHGSEDVFWREPKDLEVIGNYWQNPELIEELNLELYNVAADASVELKKGNK